MWRRGVFWSGHGGKRPAMEGAAGSLAFMHAYGQHFPEETIDLVAYRETIREAAVRAEQQGLEPRWLGQD